VLPETERSWRGPTTCSFCHGQQILRYALDDSCVVASIACALQLFYDRSNMPLVKNLGILLSGRGSNFIAIADSIDAGRIPGARIAVVISNRADAPGIEIARQRGLEARVIPSKGKQREEHDAEVVAALKEKHVDLVCMAGYMRLLSAWFCQQFPNRILNIHPSLLPAFPGLDAQYQALQHGVKISGCTVHFVDENLDAGPIVRQAAVPVLDDDTVESLSARILEEEHRIYSEAIAIVLSRSYDLKNRRVQIKQ